MLRDLAVQRIKDNLGFYTGLTDTIVNALQDAQTELEHEQFLPRFLIIHEWPLLTVAATRTISLPPDFLREDEEDSLYYVSPEEGLVELVKDELKFLRKNVPDVESGSDAAPVAYAIDGTSIFIFPKPLAVHSLSMSYYAQDAPLTSNIENKWLKHASEYMIGKAGKKIAGPLRDVKAMAIFENMTNDGKRRLIFGQEANYNEGRRYVMGGED